LLKIEIIIFDSLTEQMIFYNWRSLN